MPLLRIRRATLLAGLSLALLGGASASSASTATWGAANAIQDIAAPEPAKKPKKERTNAPKPASAARQDASRGQSGEAGTVEVTLFSTRIAPAPSVNEPARQKPNGSKPVKNRKEQKSAKAEPPEPVIPSGPLHIIVSIDAQKATLFANGQYVASTKVSTGTKTHPTPLGVFSVIQKNRHHVSNLYGAPMPYMQRLTWSGTALHTGALPGYPASHGCIRLTDQFAQLIWKATKLGTRVIVTRDEVKPSEISHTRLAMAAARPVASLPETTGSVVRTAEATSTGAAASDSSPNMDIAAPKPIINDPTIAGDGAKDSGKTLTKGVKAAPPAPVSIFISRKDSKLYVRQAMQPLFDLPLKLRDPAQPLGTHVYTAMEMKEGGMRWTAVSIPSSFPREAAKGETGKKGNRKASDAAPAAPQAPLPTPTEALDRIELPQEALERLAGLVIPGSSLIVSDNPISGETGKYTDFIILTR